MEAMKVTFAEQDESFIKRQVEQGYYANATEVVRDAVRRLRENTPQARLAVALEAAEKSAEEGRTNELTPERLAALRDRAISRAQNGEEIRHSDATP
jgi:antitoxin ParD1/3/4